MSERISQKVCFIGGAGHSGSTLLGFILGSHSQGFYCGEASKTRFLGDERKRIAKRVCKICGVNCPVWSNFSPDSPLDLYEQVARLVDKPLIIDSAKNVDWIRQQSQRLEQTSSQQFLIFLQRDGRAVINSRMRKYPEMDVSELIQDWKQQIECTMHLFDQYPHPKLSIHYEDLASQPIPTVQRICQFLEIDYQAEMLNYTQQDHHVLGGNNGTQFLVAKAQQDKLTAPFVALSERNRYYYEEHSANIVLDLRWKQELDSSTVKVFEDLAGDVNQTLKWNG